MRCLLAVMAVAVLLADSSTASADLIPVNKLDVQVRYHLITLQEQGPPGPVGNHVSAFHNIYSTLDFNGVFSPYGSSIFGGGGRGFTVASVTRVGSDTVYELEWDSNNGMYMTFPDYISTGGGYDGGNYIPGAYLAFAPVWATLIVPDSAPTGGKFSAWVPTQSLRLGNEYDPTPFWVGTEVTGDVWLTIGGGGGIPFNINTYLAGEITPPSQWLGANLTFKPFPEPSAFVLLAIGAVVMLGWCVRRRIYVLSGGGDSPGG